MESKAGRLGPMVTCLVLIGLLGLSDLSPAQGPVKVGFIYPDTGFLAEVGLDLRPKATTQSASSTSFTTARPWIPPRTSASWGRTRPGTGARRRVCRIRATWAPR